MPQLPVLPGGDLDCEGMGWQLGNDVDFAAFRPVVEGLGLRLDCWYRPPVEMNDGYAPLSRLAQSLHTALAERGAPVAYAAWGSSHWVGFYDVLWQREHDHVIRRCAIERMGWLRYLDEAGMQPVGPAVPDPEHPDQLLVLFDVPESRLLFGTKVLVRVFADGSRQATEVKHKVSDPVSAAALVRR